jgi:hypothetical protein
MKKITQLNYLMIAILVAALTACDAQSQSGNANNLTVDRPDVEVQTQDFRDYWYAGQAELSHYDLEQIRYGQVRDGSAIMIFVTEDFLNEKQVKLESPANGRDHETILKLNFLKEFNTGIYTYNVMTSTFTPININQTPHSLKVSSSSQEWCGTTWSQLNLRGSKYEVTGHSYFEDEADYEATLNAAWLEDEIWTQLRLSPELLPEGEIDIIPASFGVRRSHSGWAVEKATVKKEKWTGDGMPGENLMAYSIEYKNRDRNLTIVYENESPYRIAGWIQTQETEDGKKLEAKSVRTNIIKEPYWQQNSNADEQLRERLGLDS